MVIVVYILVTFMIAKQEYIKEKFNADQSSVFACHKSSFSSQWWWLKSVIFQIQMREAFFPTA